MPPYLALFLWLVFLLGLLVVDPAEHSGTSMALWVPLTWLLIVGSRLPSQWLGATVGTSAQAFEEGNALDRTIFFLLIVLAIAALTKRRFKWGAFLGQNVALVAFVFFALLSVVWSDYPFVAFKRWYRDLGFYLMPLVVLSDASPVEAMRTVLRRFSYILISLSVVLVKYFPYVGRGYDMWTGIASYCGATTGKNLLGALCMISGLFFFWDTVTRWSDRKERRTKRIILVNFAFIGMTLWLLNLAPSATSRVCLAIGCMVIAATHSKIGRRHPGFLKTMIPASFLLYLILAYGFNVNGELASAVGRDPTLTDRTLIWKIVLGMHTNPIIGTGYESFWLGSRYEQIRRYFEAGLNEAHNGYLEIYLSLGMIGVCLLIGFLIASYRTICKKLTPFSNLGSLSLALWLIVVFYNMSESAFKFHLVWATFLLAAIAVPKRTENQSGSVRPSLATCTTERFPSPRLELAIPRR
jgi:exopolysaccharide production protein ExoQ